MEMKIVCISDTHNKHKQIPEDWFPEGDVIVHAGDISSMGYLHEIEEFFYLQIKNWLPNDFLEYDSFFSAINFSDFCENNFILVFKCLSL